MNRTQQPFYDYLEVRDIQNHRSTRKRKVRPANDPLGACNDFPSYHASSAAAWFYHQLEGGERRHPSDPPESAWGQTVLRIFRHIGDPGLERLPQRPEEIDDLLRSGAQIPDPHTWGPRLRIHHYYRIFSAADCARADRKAGVSIAIDITEEWHSPRNGVVSPIPIDSSAIATHCISGLWRDTSSQGFHFVNSWGTDWGDKGFGVISGSDIDRFLVDGWATVGMADFPPISNHSGHAIVLWKRSDGGREVHGREIIDTRTGERIAWAFFVRRGGMLDIDELFVWPQYRRQGFGTILCTLAKELSREMRHPLRALIGYVDAYPVDSGQLSKVLSLLGLTAHPSEIPGIAMVGLSGKQHSTFAPRIPGKPTAPQGKLDPANSTRLYKVWFGTNRVLKSSTNSAIEFGEERDSSIHYGICTVSIPRSHRFGSVGSSFFSRYLRWTDDRLRVVQCTAMPDSEFWTSVSEALRGSQVAEQDALVFIHGFNTTFEESAIRAAQIGYDLKISGAMAFYSWPSAGSLLSYTEDESTIEASEPYIVQFLKDFSHLVGAGRLHIIVHSMGNRGFLRALQRIAREAADNEGVRFGQVILAAPDLDVDVFIENSDLYREYGERTTLYVSPRDLAVRASRWIHGYSRVGFTPPITIAEGIDTIEVPKFNVMDLGHGYFAEAEGLLADMFHLIRHGTIPEHRQRLDVMESPEGLRYWVMVR